MASTILRSAIARHSAEVNGDTVSSGANLANEEAGKRPGWAGPLSQKRASSAPRKLHVALFPETVELPYARDSQMAVRNPGRCRLCCFLFPSKSGLTLAALGANRCNGSHCNRPAGPGRP